MKKARVIYNETEDTFEVQFTSDEEWVTETTYTCQPSARQTMGDANFIHFSILKELAKLEHLGYKITFKALL